MAFYYICLLFVFTMPVFGRILPLILGLMALNWVIEGSYLKLFPLLRNERKRFWLVFFSLIYLLYLIGLLYSRNLDYGRFDIQVKLPLLAFPLIFLTTGKTLFTKKRIDTILKCFVAGSLAGSFLFFGHAWYNAAQLGLKGSFYYSNLSWFFHPSYISMYFSFAVSILVFFLVEKGERMSGLTILIHFLLILYFFVFIILLSSKAGILGLTASVFIWILVLLFKKKKWKYAILATLLTITTLYSGFKIFPFASERFSQAEQSLHSDNNTHSDPTKKSTSDRIQIWKASSKIIGRNIAFGVGTGDVKDELIKEYKIENISEGFQKKLNAHNQYIQTFITLGIPGFLLLISMFVFPGRIALRNDLYLYLAFLLIFSLNITVESMLETQAGVIFYSFFNTFLFAAYFCFPSLPKGSAVKRFPE